jgi:lysophospholipase L1-like esterase
VKKKMDNPPIRVACVGDSITYGMFVPVRRRNCYPAALSGLLGSGYAVKNFGAVDYCMQSTADKPYQSHALFAQSLAWAPDIVCIALGTNDTKTKNWRGAAAFLEACGILTETYAALPSQPALFLLSPPAAFARLGKLRWGVVAPQLEEIAHLLPPFAAARGFGFVDIYAATAAHPECFRLDGVHPGRRGAALIARQVFRALKPEDRSYDQNAWNSSAGSP